MLLLQKRMGALERLEPSDPPRRRQPHHGHALPAQHAVPRLLPPPRQHERMNVERGGDRLHPHPTLPAEAHRSTIGREVQRNGTPRDDCYRPQLADWYARGRRSRSRRNRRFTAEAWARIQVLLREDWSPEQVAGWLRRHQELTISHETIYRYLWADKHAGGTLYLHLRGARKRRRKRYGRYDSRGRLAGKRPITARPAAADARTEVGHWEADTMLGASQAGPCVLSLVERKTGYLVLGQLRQRTSAAVNQRAHRLIASQPHPVRSITVDNGTEFHEYAQLERA